MLRSYLKQLDEKLRTPGPVNEIATILEEKTKIQRKNGHWVWMDNGHVENMVHTQQASLKHTSFANKYHVYD